MTESEVRAVLLVQAIETQPRVPGAAPWSAADAAEASAAAAQAVGAQAGFEAFLVARARLVLHRLAERVPGLRGLPGLGAAPALGGAWPVCIVGLGALGLGVAAEAGGSGGRIQLLAWPWLGLVAWNGLVYAGLLARWLLRRGRRAPAAPVGAAGAADVGGGSPAGAAGLLAGLAGRLDDWTGRWPGRPGAGRHATERHAPGWWRAARREQALMLQPLLAPVRRQQGLALLHVGAAMLALGLLLSLYARGLVFDFRAGWDSTFLSVTQVHALLTATLAPAALWPGLALPGAEDLARWRWADGGAGTPAGPWIHRIALTLAAWVVLPRLALAALALWQARRAAARLQPATEGPYADALRAHAPATPRPVNVLPYNCHDSARATGLAAALAQQFGPGVRPRLLPVLPLGAEDRLPAGLPPDPGPELVVLMALNATPEAEHHGALFAGVARCLPPGVRASVLLDSHAFARRLAGQPDAPQRQARRLAAWQALADAAGLGPVRVADLGPPAVTDQAPEVLR